MLQTVSTSPSGGREEGPPSGGGPDGADQMLEQQVRVALRTTGRPALRDVGIEVKSGQVLLSGVVPTYYAKQVAQAAVLALREVIRLRNEIEVV